MELHTIKRWTRYVCGEEFSKNILRILKEVSQWGEELECGEDGFFFFDLCGEREREMSIEVEETIKRIQSHKGVKGVLIMNTEGIPIRSNFSPEDTENYASLVSQVQYLSHLFAVRFLFLLSKALLIVFFLQLALKAAGVVRTLDDSDELAFMRVRSKKHEIMVAPDKDYVLVVVQTPNES